MRSIFAKGIILSFYLTLLVLFLYIPRIIEHLNKDDQSLNLYSFTEMVSPESLELFRQKTGINVFITYFESNEELFTKLRITGGQGYDLLVASDYMIELLQREDLLQKLDKKRLQYFHELDTRLLGHFYDRDNQYSLPLAWVTYGLVADKTFFSSCLNKVTLKLIFEPPHALWNLASVQSKNFRLCVPNDARELILLAALYLFNRVDNLHDQEYEQIKQLLIRQKKWIESYTNEGLQYLLMGNIVPVVYGSSMFLLSTHEYTNRFDLKIPEEGSLFVIENMALPKKSQKLDAVYALINFLMHKDIAYLNSNLYGYNPTNRYTYERINKNLLAQKDLFPDNQMFRRLHLIHNNLSVERIEDIWLAVKSA